MTEPKLNAHQMPKTPGFLSCWVARPGHRWVGSDFSSVEPHVLAEFSRDPALLALYGPDAKQNDIYLFTAWHIRGLGDEIKKYYDAYNPTPESISLAKKHCKSMRQVAKTVALGCGYGAGPGKIQETLQLGGIHLEFDEVRTIHQAYWELYEGVKDFERRLVSEWRRNGGWILNAMGWPISVAEDKLKDIVNRFCQTSGHLLLQRRIRRLTHHRRTQGLEMWPLIVDDHDNSMWEATEQDLPRVVGAFDESLSWLNRQLGWTVKIKGDTIVGDNLADFKCED